MFRSENILIFAILMQYLDISVIVFVVRFGYCISVFEINCTSAVNTYILPSPNRGQQPGLFMPAYLQQFECFRLITTHISHRVAVAVVVVDEVVAVDVEEMC